MTFGRDEYINVNLQQVLWSGNSASEHLTRVDRERWGKDTPYCGHSLFAGPPDHLMFRLSVAWAGRGVRGARHSGSLRIVRLEH